MHPLAQQDHRKRKRADQAVPGLEADKASGKRADAPPTLSHPLKPAGGPSSTSEAGRLTVPTTQPPTLDDRTATKPSCSASGRHGTLGSGSATQGPAIPKEPLTTAFVPSNPSGARCADRSLQLDVDVLMLDYLLYQATCAQLSALKMLQMSESNRAAGHSDRLRTAERTAQALLQVFQASLQQLQFFHPSHKLQAGTDFNTILLETIILLRSMKMESQQSTSSKDAAAAALEDNASNEIKDYLRRRTLTASFDQSDHTVLLRTKTSDEDAATMFETIRGHLFYGWTSSLPQDPEKPSRIFPMFRVLVRFMILSARINQQMEESDINEYWMRLACELMLHAALEALQCSDFLSTNGNIDPGTPHSNVQPGILDCFAFCSLPTKAYDATILHYRTSPFTDPSSPPEGKTAIQLDQSTKDEEQAIGEIFRENSETWDTMRRSYLSEFKLPALHRTTSSETLTMVSAASHYQQIIPHLRKKYPFAKTKAALVQCLESLWQVNTSPGISGKPLLVQIEEGGLEGLDDREFSTFLTRVDLSRNDLATKQRQ